MSYILDALKKADQARQYGQVPGIDSAHAQPLPEQPRRRWPWIVAAALLVNVLLIAALWWHLRPGQGNHETVPVPPATTTAQSRPNALRNSTPPAARTETKPPAVVTAAPSAETAVASTITAPPPVKDRKVANAVAPKPPAPVIALRPLPLPTPAAPPATAPAPARTVDLAVEEPAPFEPLPESAPIDRSDVVQLKAASRLPPPPPPPQAEPAWKNLPLWPLAPERIRRQVSGRLILNAHVYSENPAERFVLLNMQKYREGQQTPEGPEVEEITRDGVIFAVPNGRFRLE